MTNIALAESLMESFVIEGGRSLAGRVRAAGNKNAALPILAACALTSEPVELTNVPRIRDVETMLELLSEIGADVEWQGPDPIGRRRLDVHMHAFASLGAEVAVAGRFDIRADALSGTDMYLDEPSVTGTENAVMAAVLARGETVIANAASEPHVQDLCHFLGTLGARISGIGSNVLRIEGVREVGGGSWRICPDHIEVGSFIGCAAVTGGDVTIEEARRPDLISILPAFERLGIRVEMDGASV